MRNGNDARPGDLFHRLFLLFPFLFIILLVNCAAKNPPLKTEDCLTPTDEIRKLPAETRDGMCFFAISGKVRKIGPSGATEKVGKAKISLFVNDKISSFEINPKRDGSFSLPSHVLQVFTNSTERRWFIDGGCYSESYEPSILCIISADGCQDLPLALSCKSGSLDIILSAKQNIDRKHYVTNFYGNEIKAGTEDYPIDADPFEWQNKGPLDFLAYLTSKRCHGFCFYTIWGKHHDWIKDEDLPGLMLLLYSQASCDNIMVAESSYIDTKPSTIGNEAALLIKGFREGQYPQRGLLNSTRLGEYDFDVQEIIEWYLSYLKDKSSYAQDNR